MQAVVLTLGPALYKFIVMGPPGPDPIYPWGLAQPEKCGPHNWRRLREELLMRW